MKTVEEAIEELQKLNPKAVITYVDGFGEEHVIKGFTEYEGEVYMELDWSSEED